MPQHYWQQQQKLRIYRSAFLAGVIVFLVSLAGTLFLYIKLSRREAQFLQETSNHLAHQVQNSIVTQITSRVQSLERQAKHWNIYGPFSGEQFHAQAQMQMSHFPGYEAVVWADTSGVVRLAEPLKGHEAAIGLNLKDEVRRRNALLLARESGQTVFTPLVNLMSGGNGFLAFSPVKDDNGMNVGFVLGVFRYDQLFKAILPIGQLDKFELIVFCNNEEIYRYKDHSQNLLPGSIREFPIYGTSWKIELWPKIEKNREVQLSVWVLVIGGFFSVLMGLAVGLWLIAKRQAGRIAEFSQLEFSSFFELSGSGAVMVDPATNKFTRANSMFCTMLGYTEEELKTMSFLDITHPAEREREEQNYEEVKAGKRDHWQSEKRYLCHNGKVIWGLVSGTMVRSPSGKPLFSVALVQDITENRQTQDALRLALQSRDEFLSIASHELKTPLTSIQLQTQMTRRALELKGEVPSPERLLYFLVQTEKQVQRIARLINDMLEISRISLGKLSLAPESFDLSALGREVCEKLSPIAEEARTSITLDASPVEGTWDPFRIEQVLTNLITNAIKYGEGTAVKVRVWSEQKFAYISVSDQGRGIAAADQSRIFERFERAISPSEVSGMGLGLFISNEIIKAHHGSIKVESIPGKGSTFTVSLSLRPSG